MPKLEFSFNLPTEPNQLMKLSEDYESIPQYLPDQLKSVKIIEQNGNETKTEEIIVFSTLLKKEIIQHALHRKNGNNQLTTEIISGPAKGTTLNVTFEKIDSGTKVVFDVDLKLSIKAKFLQPLIKKYYKMVLTSVLYKMNNTILQSQTNGG
ncbi:type II toxin-antitoxin system RatA family toxin [Candidatus Nitrosotenuis cloacae]|nr:SRPBCC family protein [Candidatus Nitrosotenuis cloacae]